MAEEKKVLAGKKKGFTTQEIVLLAVLGVVFGILNVVLGQVPQWAGAIGGCLLSAAVGGFVQISQTLGGYIVRRPGAATLVMLINVAAQFLAGNPTGALLFVFGLAQGIPADLVFACRGYGKKPIGFWTMFIAAGMANMGCQLVFPLLFEWQYTGLEFILSLPASFIGGGIEGGIIAWLLAKALDRTGLIQNIRKNSDKSVA